MLTDDGVDAVAGSLPLVPPLIIVHSTVETHSSEADVIYQAANDEGIYARFLGSWRAQTDANIGRDPGSQEDESCIDKDVYGDIFPDLRRRLGLWPSLFCARCFPGDDRRLDGEAPLTLRRSLQVLSRTWVWGFTKAGV